MNREEVLKLFSYMITSARGCVGEPKLYGPFRILDSMSRLYYLLKENNLINEEGLAKIIDLIDEKKYSCMTDKEEFISMLDQAVDGMVDIMSR
ncbi:MAG: hypothetical protein GX969_00860 [Firmicutes bacterium]|mgnify:CR=1 FL=1|nr:hypothetical protein [Bacillota bacterium]